VGFSRIDALRVNGKRLGRPDTGHKPDELTSERGKQNHSCLAEGVAGGSKGMTVSSPDDPVQVGRELSERRSQLVAEGNAAAQAHDYDRAIERYLLTTFYDTLGPYRPMFDHTGRTTGYAFDQRFAFVGTGVLHRIAKCANAGDVDFFEIQMRFMDLAAVESTAIAHLRPPLSPEEAWARIEEGLRKWLANDARLRLAAMPTSSQAAKSRV
jgi:hypothetical protein